MATSLDIAGYTSYSISIPSGGNGRNVDTSDISVNLPYNIGDEFWY